jgi:hypothetical protein
MVGLCLFVTAAPATRRGFGAVELVERLRLDFHDLFRVPPKSQTPMRSLKLRQGLPGRHEGEPLAGGPQYRTARALDAPRRSQEARQSARRRKAGLGRLEPPLMLSEGRRGPPTRQEAE